MKRPWAWIVGVGIAWALLAPALPSLIETVRYSLAMTDFVSMSDHLETVVDVVFSRSVAIPIIAAVLCFVLVVFAKAPARVWLGVLLGVVFGVLRALTGFALTAALLGGGFALESLPAFVRYNMLYSCLTVLAAWIGVVLANWWLGAIPVMREAREERIAAQSVPKVPVEPDDWDEPFDTRADDTRA